MKNENIKSSAGYWRFVFLGEPRNTLKVIPATKEGSS